MAIQIIHDLLIADPSVAAIVSDRVYPLVRPQSFPAPAVTLQRITVTPVNSLDTALYSIAENRVQVDSWDVTYMGARTLADACRAAINAAGHILDTELDNFAPDAPLSGVYRITQDYSIWL